MKNKMWSWLLVPAWLGAALLVTYAQEKKEDGQSKSDAVPVEMLESDKKQYSGDKLKKVEDGIRRARKTVVRLDMPGGVGSGVAIKWKGKMYFVSVAHIFGKGTVKGPINMPGPLKLDESEYTVEKIAIDKATDTSAFKILNPREDMAYAEVNENPQLSKGTPVLVLTYPMGRGLRKGFPVHDVALVDSSSATEIAAGDVFISHSAGSPDGEKVTVGPGSSGGGMFDIDGKLIGIVQLVRGEKSKGIVGAIPISTALKLIKD